MRHKLIALLGGGIQRHRIIHLVVGGIRNLLVAAIDARRTRIDEMFDFEVSAGFKNVVETDEVALDIGVRVRDGVTDARLCSEIHDNSEMIFFKEAVNCSFIRKVRFHESPFFAGRNRERFDFLEAFVLDVHVIVVGDGIKTDKFGAVIVVEQLFAKIASDKACGTSYKDRLSI